MINVFLPLLLLLPSLFARPWHPIGNQELAMTSPTGSLESRRHFYFKPDDPPSLYGLVRKQTMCSILVVPSVSLAGRQLIRRSKTLLAGVRSSFTWQPVDKVSLRSRTVLFLTRSVAKCVAMASQVVSTLSVGLTVLHEKWRPTCEFSGDTQTTLSACYF